jgi:putative transposase
MTHDYIEHGTTTLLAALSVLEGWVVGAYRPRHRHREFPEPQILDLIVDNFTTHKHASGEKWGARYPRSYLHLTPTWSFRVYPVDRWFPKLPDMGMRPRLFVIVADLILSSDSDRPTHCASVSAFIRTATVGCVLVKLSKGKATNASDTLR